MSDQVENFRAMRAHEQDERANQYEQNMAVLVQSGLAYRVTNNGQNVIFRERGKPKVDFYPSTGRWRVVGDPSHRRTYSGGAAAFLVWYRKQEAP